MRHPIHAGLLRPFHRLDRWVAPAFLKEHLAQRELRRPPSALKLGLAEERAGIPEAQVRHRQDRLRDAEDGAQVIVVKNTDPSDTNPFDSGREPEVLDGTARAAHVRIGHGVASEDMGTGAGPIAGDTEVNGGLLDPLELQRPVQVRASARVLGERPLILDLERESQ